VNNEHSFRVNPTTLNPADWGPALRRSRDFAIRNTIKAAEQPLPPRPPTTPPPLRQPANQSSASQHPARRNGHEAPPARSNPAETDFLIETRHREDDPPFQVPAIWNAPPLPANNVGIWDWSERSTAAFLGFAAGVLVVIPTVLYLGATTDPDNFSSAASGTPPAAVKSEPANQPMTSMMTPAVIRSDAGAGMWFNSHPSNPANTPETAQTNKPQLSAATAGQQAQAALIQGRLSQARAFLRDAASPEAPQLWFQLAETYDPRTATNQAATSARDAGGLMSDADIEFARYYYQRALTYGVEQARARLVALPGQ
jgi:hypothetical protein